MDPLLIGGAALITYLFFSKKSSGVDQLVNQALPIAQDQMAAGASFDQAVARAASMITEQLPPSAYLGTLLGVKRTVFMDSALSDAIEKAKAAGLTVTPIYGQTLYKGTKSEVIETSYWAKDNRPQ